MAVGVILQTRMPVAGVDGLDSCGCMREPDLIGCCGKVLDVCLGGKRGDLEVRVLSSWVASIGSSCCAWPDMQGSIFAHAAAPS